MLKPRKRNLKPKTRSKSARNTTKVELENKQVRVLQINYGPREKSVMRGHPARVAVFLSEGRARFPFPDGKSEERSWTAGQSLFIPAETHLPENLTDKALESVLVTGFLPSAPSNYPPRNRFTGIPRPSGERGGVAWRRKTAATEGCILPSFPGESGTLEIVACRAGLRHELATIEAMFNASKILRVL